MDAERVEIGAEVAALLRALGYDGKPELVRSVTLYPREVLLELYRTNEDGAKYVDRETGEAASDTRRILIGVEDPA
jgi:hypothetical protein